jgi:hypothetical protein
MKSSDQRGSCKVKKKKLEEEEESLERRTEWNNPKTPDKIKMIKQLL